MRVFHRLLHDVKVGWATLRYGTASAATRALEEAELLRLRAELRKLDEQMNELYGDIGERAVELYERSVSSDRIRDDHDIVRSLDQIAGLAAERARVTGEMEDTRTNHAT